MKRKIINSLKVLVLSGLALTVFLPGAALAFQPSVQVEMTQPLKNSQMIDLHQVQVEVAKPAEQKLGSIPPETLIPTPSTTFTPAPNTTPTPSGNTTPTPSGSTTPTPTGGTTPTVSTTPTPKNPVTNRTRLPFTGNNPVMFYSIGLIVLLGGLAMIVRQYKLNSK